MSRRPSEKAITLPAPLYFTIPELCQRWGCHQDRPLLYMDSGLLVPAALVPKYELPLPAHAGVAPNVCVVLDNYRELVWTHDTGEAITCISGKFTAVSATGTGWRTLELDLPEALCINRRSLVVLDAEREEVEESLAATPPKKPNRAEQRATALIIRALVGKAYGQDALEHSYTTAAKIVTEIELMGAAISRQAVANKLKAVAELRRPRDVTRLDGPAVTFQKIDKTVLKRVLGTHNHQAVLLDQLFKQL